MKVFFQIVIALSFWTGVIFLFGGFHSEEEKNISANVNQVEGFFIYSYCKPIAETNYIGTVNVPTVVSDKADERLKRLIKLAKKSFPKAEGLILSDDFGKADVITFKDDK